MEECKWFLGCRITEDAKRKERPIFEWYKYRQIMVC
jgi:hypothetical protein